MLAFKYIIHAIHTYLDVDQSFKEDEFEILGISLLNMKFILKYL
jgi:hypothetical protein